MRLAATGRRKWLALPGRPGRATGLTAAAAGLAMVAGCHVPGTSSGTSAPNASATITVEAEPGVPDAPLYIGLRDGLFKDAGLTVRIRPASSAREAVAQLQSGHADIAFENYADMFYAKEQKSSSNLVVAADGYACAPGVVEVLALPNSGITSPQDLLGKTIGTASAQILPAKSASPRPYSVDTVAAWSALSNQNVDPTKVIWDPMPASQLITALSVRQVRAILVTEPDIYEAEQRLGAVPVLDACSGATANLPLDGYFTTRAFSRHNPATLAAFRSALGKAQADGTMTAPVQAVLKGDAKMSGQTAALVTIGIYPTSLEAPSLQRVANLMFFYNALTTPLTVAGMVVPASGSH